MAEGGKKALWSLLALVMMMMPLATFGINVSSLHYSACRREIGVILTVNENNIQLLTLRGEVVQIPGYEVIYMASHAVANLPIKKIANPRQTDIIIVRTLYNNEILELLRGWMINHSEEKMSFLTTDGKEVVVDRGDIWDVDILEPLQVQAEIAFESTLDRRYRFSYPPPFSSCEKDGADKKDSVRRIAPQHLYEDHSLIKGELDRLEDGYDQLMHYQSHESYYAIPQLYGNSASIGIWASAGSRYGASVSRTNFIPEITSEFSEGPFGFQRTLVTGSSLMPYSVHEEPQVQAYYRFKSSYVHGSLMYDFNRMLISETNYFWQPEDMTEEYDQRMNEKYHAALGFDFGHFSIDYYMFNQLNYAIRFRDEFFSDAVDFPKIGVGYQNRFFKGEFFLAHRLDNKPEAVPMAYSETASTPVKAWITEYNRLLELKPNWWATNRFSRFNLELYMFSDLEFHYSLIGKTTSMEREADVNNEGEFRYRGASITHAFYLSYPLTRQFLLKGFASLETLTIKVGQYDVEEDKTTMYPKAGANFSLVF